MPVPALKVSNLRKVYRRGTVAVDDLSLTIPEGEFFGFLGPNGAGKSTTIHCITGIAEPTEGKIEIFGLDAVKDYREARRLVGLCPQEFNVDPFANPRQIVDWMGGYFGMAAHARKERIDMLMEKFELIPHQKKQFRELSGGLKRRVVLARALVHDPRLIILDEPLTGLDALSARHVKGLLQERVRSGCTVIMTTHILEVAERMADRIGVIAAGKLVAEGTLTELRQQNGRTDTSLEDMFIALVDTEAAAA